MFNCVSKIWVGKVQNWVFVTELYAISAINAEIKPIILRTCFAIYLLKSINYLHAIYFIKELTWPEILFKERMLGRL